MLAAPVLAIEAIAVQVKPPLMLRLTVKLDSLFALSVQFRTTVAEVVRTAAVSAVGATGGLIWATLSVFDAAEVPVALTANTWYW